MFDLLPHSGLACPRGSGAFGTQTGRARRCRCFARFLYAYVGNTRLNATDPTGKKLKLASTAPR